MPKNISIATAPTKLNKTQRGVTAMLESIGLGGLDIRLGDVPILDLPIGDLRRIAFRLHHPLSAGAQPGRWATPRAQIEAETRVMFLKLGALWLRANGSVTYGKKTLAEVSDAEITETDTAALAG